jgi:hypothetical protein
MAVDNMDMIARQKGVALLVFVVFIAIAAIAYFLSGVSVHEARHFQKVSTSKALHQAKQALLAYAATRADVSVPSPQQGEYGFLPCPETFKNGTEGNSAPSCNGTGINALGWLPWKSLGLPPLKDESGACLLYAVSASYKKNPSYDMVNEDTNGMFQIVDEAGAVITGNNAEDRVVAVIFAPGKALPGQNRNNNPGSVCGEDYANYDAYLDIGGATDNSDVDTATNAIDQFIHASASSISSANPNPYNDRFITISRREIWDAVLRRTDFIASPSSKIRRLAEALAQCIAAYGNSNNNRWLPMPAAENLSGNDYRDNYSYDDDSGANHRGRYPFIVNTADGIIPGTSGGSILFDKGICNALPIQFPPGPGADLTTASMTEDRVMWEHWKDHIFYAVSDTYDPKSVPLVPDPAPRCGPCVQVNGVDYAAVVIYSNSRLAGQVREAPIASSDIDTKNNYLNYIEVVNPDTAGTGDFTPTAASNDIMYCITDTEPLDIVTCP